MNSSIEEKRKDILYWMLDYIEGDDEPPYTKSDVDEFSKILDNFITTVTNTSEKSNYEWVTSKVKDLVLKLNEFNEKHDYSIIETDQREGICDLIDHVIQQSGHSVTEDITEEWREW